MPETNCDSCTLRRKECFRHLDEEEVQFVRGMRSGMGVLSAGHFVIRAGETPKALYTILEGWAVACPDVPGEPLRANEVMLPGDLIGTQGCITGRYSHSIVALTRLRYCVLDRSIPEKLAKRGGALCFALMRHFAQERSRRERLATLLASATASQRVAYFLFETFSRLRAVGLADETMCPFPLRRTQLAQIVGLSEVHVSRTLAAMRKDGLIEIENNILIVADEQRLGEIAGLRPVTYPEGRFIL